MKNYIYIFLVFLSCTSVEEKEIAEQNAPFILILGTAQDAGYPQIACQKSAVN